MNSIATRCLHYAERAPFELALADGARRLTFAELRRVVGAMTTLFALRGVARGDVVAIAGRKTVWHTVASLAAIGVGATYLPVDPQPPLARTRTILARAEPALYVDDRASELTAEHPSLLVDEATWGRLVQATTLTAPIDVDEGETAYMIFTSGSTGVPRGVCISHRALDTFVDAVSTVMEYAPGARCLALAPPYFDVAIQDTLVPLARGASVFLHAGLPIPAQILHQLADKRITHTTLVASNLALVASESRLPTLRGRLDALRRIMTGAEAPSPDAAFALLHTAPNACVVNGYGPTEATVCCTAHVITPATARDFENYPIGEALPGVRAIVVDEHGEQRSGTEVGELCIAGPQVMTGYFKDAAATDRVILHEGGERYLRTGDLVRRVPGYGFEFLGRGDRQVKVRGYRVHPEELRAALLAFAGVRDAYVCAGTFGEEQGLAALVEAQDASLSARPLLAHVAERLPAYMRPVRLRVLRELPRTRNGKADTHRALAMLQETPTEEPS
jgi:amino acid adenylation domain-containing protein